VRVEVVVVDDASTDDTCATVARWMEGNAGVPVLLARHPAGRGTGATRNTAIDLARGRFIFVLDAGNALYPGGLAALVDAFDLPDVAFTYGMLECFDDTGPTGLRNTYAWNPGRLADGNVVDAMALLRTRVVREAGGFSTDLRLDGWEEYDLWCTLAERGYRGSLVPAIVGRRRISPSSRVLTEIDHDDARARLRERHPRILAVGSAPS
jgi:glycosyltransferase involved in cell wall biosynthesis